MNKEIFLDILKNPNENGVTVFVIGVLFVLSVYHFLLYFQHKDKSYLFYSLYTFLVFIGLLNRPVNGFVRVLVQPHIDLLNHLSKNAILVYNLVYFIFMFTLFDLKSYSKKWNTFIFKTIYGIFIFTVLIEIGYLISGNEDFITKGHLIFMIAAYILGVISFSLLFKINDQHKNYFIIGSFFLFAATIAISIIKRIGLTYDQQEIRYSIFYIGLLMEVFFFTLALGAKQKRIIIAENQSKKRLIIQLQENEILREKVHKQLKEDYKTLSKLAEKEKLKNLNAKYEKELAELKILALRSQMNPHFIFNSLNAIKLYIIEHDTKNAVYYLNKFSKLIRKILSTTREKEILLADEIETMNLYVNIENIRFSNEILFSIDVDENLNVDTIKIPPLILQPFIENAIWHGLSNKKGSKKLHLSIEKESEKHIRITIKDNGIGRTMSEEIIQNKVHKKESIGIKLTEERLNNFSTDYQNDYSLNINDLYDKNNNASGTEVIVRVPII